MDRQEKNSSQGSVSFTIPLHITVSIGAPAAMPPVGVPAAGRELAAAPAAAVEAVTQFSPDSLAAPQFTWRTALSLALASQLAYSPANEVQSTGLAWGLGTCKFIQAMDTECFVATTPQVVLVAFRGTQGIRDWLADLNARRVTRTYGLVHRGFYHAFADVRSQIEAELGSIGGRRLVLTGHSLGGALATVAAAEWSNANSHRVSAVYTYGQPRVGNATFRAFVNSKVGSAYHRFVNDDDIVPRVPPGFWHVGRLIHFDASGNLQSSLEAAPAGALEAISSAAGVTEPPALTESEFDQLRAQLLAARRGGSLESVPESSLATPQLEGFFPSISDHSLAGYISKIARFVN